MKSSEPAKTNVLAKLGISEEALEREKALKMIGISELDIQKDAEHAKYCGVIKAKTNFSKPESQLGVCEDQIKREKAIMRLGTTEEEIDTAYRQYTSSLGAQLEQ